jgi:hypothetical protein
MDFMAADGSQFGTVDQPAPVGTTIECIACHNAATLQHDSVIFPSGIELADLGDQAVCVECHQGRASKAAVDEAVAAAVGDDLDRVNPDLAFINIHYSPAAATRYGSEVQGGYEYGGFQYDPRFDHAASSQACTDCHDMHTLQLKTEDCAACHPGLSTPEDAAAIRMAGSLKDYDGDGDLQEPVKAEIAGLQELLYASMQAYAAEVAGTPLVYDAANHPYFFDQAGEIYASWTGRLLRTAYNYHVSKKDPGGYVHNGKYLIQLLYDSIADLNAQISTPIDLSRLQREDAGHFAAAHDSWRHWDDSGQVPADCARCHAAGGLPVFITTAGEIYPQPATSGLYCATCHDDLSTFTRYGSEQVEFPSGAVVSFEELESNLCLNCHQGRESRRSVDAAIAASAARIDEATQDLDFPDPHFFAAGGTLWGTDVQGAYEYENKIYNGRFLHVPGFQACTECHDTHTLEVQVEQCTSCHGTYTRGELEEIRILQVDFDGDDDTTTGIAVEVSNFRNRLLEAIYVYAADTGAPIVFEEQAYPYWFSDLDADGLADPQEAADGNRYFAWTPRLLRAAYNYTWAARDPGAYAHNGLYILQVLYDSLLDIGGDVAGLVRPEVTQ